MRINFELVDLQAFHEVAARLNFRAAAEALFLSQPALSRRIDKLEQAVEARLLARTTRRVSLTAAGAQFLGQTRHLLLGLEGAVAGVREGTLRRSGQVTLACIPSVANHLLPGVLAAFGRLWPDVRVRLVDESAPRVLQAVVDGSADLGVDFIGAQEPTIEFKALCRERYLLAVPAGHRLAGRAQVAWSDLADERYIALTGGSGNGLLIEHALAQVARRPRPCIEVRHVDAALALVEANMGVAAVPSLALQGRPGRPLAGVALVKPAVARTLGLITRRGERPNPATAELIRMLAAAMRSVR